MTGTGVVDRTGREVTDKDVAIEGLSRTLIILFDALMSSNELLKEMLDDHIEAEHDGGHDALCGMKAQIAMNNSIRGFVAAVGHQAAVH